MFRLEFHAHGADELPICFPDDESAFERAMRLLACYCYDDKEAKAKIVDLETEEEKTFGCTVWKLYANLQHRD